MIPAIPPLIKVMTVLLAGSLVLSPVPKVEPTSQQAGKITNKITRTIINDLTEKQRKIDNPNYKPSPKKKLPITGGFKKGRDPLPKGTTPAGTYRNIWESLKIELGFR